MPEPRRTGSGRRDYGAQDIARLRLIGHCREPGFPLADAPALLALAGDGAASCAEAKVIAEAHLWDVRRRIRRLRDLEGALAERVGGCAAGADPCPVLRALAAP